MANNTSPVPIFETDDQCTYFLTVLPVNPEFSIQQGIRDSNQESNYENIILAFCFTPKTRMEILTKLEYSNQTKNLTGLLNLYWIKDS